MILGDHALAAEELLQRRIDIILIVDPHTDEAFLVLQPVLEDRKQRAGSAAIAGGSLFADLAIAKQVARPDQLVGQLTASSLSE